MKPKVELNSSSENYVRILLEQLLEDVEIPNRAAWDKALMPIILQCTDQVSPNVQDGDNMDIRHYIKLKKIPGGKPGHTSYVSGVIFHKNLSLKSMPRRITRPRIVLISFPIEYQRHKHHIMSLQPVIEQEKEFLHIIIDKILELQPQVLFAEKSISGLALEMLSAANVTVAHHIKHSVIKAISHCTGAEIVSSLDMLTLSVRVGFCGELYLKTYLNADVPGGKKTYIFVSGCKPSLGGTIALRGATTSILAKLKGIADFLVYVVYNLKMETCLTKEFFHSLPIGSNDILSSPREDFDPEDIPAQMFYSDLVSKYEKKLSSTSPLVVFKLPYLLVRLRTQERRLANLKLLRDQDAVGEQAAEKATLQPFHLVGAQLIHATGNEGMVQGISWISSTLYTRQSMTKPSANTKSTRDSGRVTFKEILIFSTPI